MNHKIFDEPLYPTIKPYQWEVELIESKTLRRLKYIAHYGAASLISPVVHSRYDHTIGVWKLAATFFPDDINLRIAAILHDIGHLPFSHAMEKSLGLNHHKITEKYIQNKEIKSILNKYNFKTSTYIDYLNQPSVLTGKDNILGLDHLDSFLRDTYMTGQFKSLPSKVLKRITCNEKGIETDTEMAMYLLELIINDHQLFLSPLMIGVDCLLSEAIRLHTKGHSENIIKSYINLTDIDIITMLKNSHSVDAKKIIDTILYHPNKIEIQNGRNGKGIPITVRKLYNKTPQVNGKPFTTINEQAKKKIEILTKLKCDYLINIK